MFFNSIEFFVFLLITFSIYWFALDGKLKAQNLFLLIASYVFYGWWDWRFLSLILISSFTDYAVGLFIFKSESKKARKWLLATSLFVNLGLLAYFKYANFFIVSFADLLHTVGFKANLQTLNIILPVGISFYTFQSLCYTIDIYRKEIKPTNDIISFFAYVSFFPQLVAGPIERASNLIPQFLKIRAFDLKQATNGLRFILWGLFLKTVIADPSGDYVKIIFDNYKDLLPIELAMGATYFAFQIYGDFAGYSFIAIGTGKLFGFELMQNFNYPYFSQNVTEFWRKWHISLSTWIRDYLYNPMAIWLRNMGKTGVILSLVLSFTIIGFWHGANWNFVAFGLLHGLALAFEALTKKRRKKLRKRTNTYIYSVTSWGLTMVFWIITMVFFRSANLSMAVEYLGQIFSLQLFSLPHQYLGGFIWIFILMAIEFVFRNHEIPLYLPQKKKYINWSFYIVSGVLIFLFFRAEGNEFIYFQF